MIAWIATIYVTGFTLAIFADARLDFAFTWPFVVFCRILMIFWEFWKYLLRDPLGRRF